MKFQTKENIKILIADLLLGVGLALIGIVIVTMFIISQ